MIKLLLDPGHSERKSGAISKTNPKIREYDLNVLQAQTIQKLLYGKYDITIYNPENDDLIDIGSRAVNYDALISLHLNAADGKKDYYTVTLVHDKYAKESSKILAVKISEYVGKQLSLPLYNHTGINTGGLTVLSVSERHCKGPCVLCEAFFMDCYSDLQKAQERTVMAATAISLAIDAYFKGEK
jgi:N-acetylmuramoyl-L-alanine amidase